MWTQKIKLLISLPKVLRGLCLKNLRKDWVWYHQRKCELSFPSTAWLGIPKHGVGNRKTVFQNLRQDFVRKRCSRYFAFEIATSEFWKPSWFNLESGFRFWSWGGCSREATSRIRRRSIIYITEVVYTVLNRSSVHSICDRPNPRRHVNCIH
jgi:hypothetical protein